MKTIFYLLAIALIGCTSVKKTHQKPKRNAIYKNMAQNCATENLEKRKDRITATSLYLYKIESVNSKGHNSQIVVDLQNPTI